ncbi:MAG: ankyrin repeat domain-containing protein, partial [Verrucomicrobiae bacterium]|nr:ankyrin repeat domain-containing protein [Verrucomicrobiae bacterium]
MRQIIISLCSALASATLLADPIHDAVLQGQLEQVETILKQTPAAARARDANGNTPLHLAAAAGNADIAELLLDGWAEINAVNNAGDTPLLVALNNEENPVIPLLLKKKPNLTITGAGDTTPLQRAAWNGLKNAYRMLLDAGAQPDIFSAVALGDTAVAAGLIRSNSTVLKQIGPHGGTPLHWAAARGNAATIQLLLSHNANPRTVGSDGATAFHWAAIHNNTETLSALLKQFPHLADITDNFTKTTPLQSAAAGGHTPVMQLLLQHGARLTHRNLTRNVPMIIAQTKPLFAWDCLEDSPSLKTIRDLLATLP